MPRELPLRIETNVMLERLFEAGSEGHTPDEESGSIHVPIDSLAKRDPSELLKRLGASDYSGRPGSRAEKVKDFINYCMLTDIDGEKTFRLLYEAAEASGNSVVVRVRTYKAKDGKKITSLPKSLCSEIIGSIIYAGAHERKITWKSSDSIITKYEGYPKVIIKLRD